MRFRSTPSNLPHRLALVASLLLAAPRARAQANDAAAAQHLFNEGKQLMAAKQYSAACPKFAESQRLDPGIGTMLWLAECHAKDGKLASAWALFSEAEALASKANDNKRVKLAREEAAKLEPKLSKLVIDVSAVSSLDGLEIKRDGVVLGRPLWDHPIPTDSGPHKIAVAARDKKPWEGEITVPDNAGSATIKIPPLEDAPTPEPVVIPVDKPPPSPVIIDANKGRTQRLLGITVASVGLIGVGLGTYFGLEVGSKNDDSKALCGPPVTSTVNKCTEEGKALRDEAFDAATISTVAFIAGGVLLASGAVLFLTAPKQGKTPPTLGVSAGPLPGNGGAAVLRGTF